LRHIGDISLLTFRERIKSFADKNFDSMTFAVSRCILSETKFLIAI